MAFGETSSPRGASCGPHGGAAHSWLPWSPLGKPCGGGAGGFPARLVPGSAWCLGPLLPRRGWFSAVLQEAGWAVYWKPRAAAWLGGSPLVTLTHNPHPLPPPSSEPLLWLFLCQERPLASPFSGNSPHPSRPCRGACTHRPGCPKETDPLPPPREASAPRLCVALPSAVPSWSLLALQVTVSHTKNP